MTRIGFLGSLGNRDSQTETGNIEQAEGCYSCGVCIDNIYSAIVWEAMQFCDEVRKYFQFTKCLK